MNASKALSQNTYLLELRRVGVPVGNYNDISEEWLFLGTENTPAISITMPTGWNFVCCFNLDCNIVCLDFGSFIPGKMWAGLAHTGRVTIPMGLSALNLYHFLSWSHWYWGFHLTLTPKTESCSSHLQLLSRLLHLTQCKSVLVARNRQSSGAIQRESSRKPYYSVPAPDTLICIASSILTSIFLNRHTQCPTSG